MLSPSKIKKYIPAIKLLNVAIFVFFPACMHTVTPLVHLAMLPTPAYDPVQRGLSLWAFTSKNTKTAVVVASNLIDCLSKLKVIWSCHRLAFPPALNTRWIVCSF